MASTQHSLIQLLINQLFDYAGMFPPASRSFIEALHESATLERTLKRPYMLNADIVLDTNHTQTLVQINRRSFGFTRDISIALLATDEIVNVLKVAWEALQTRGATNDIGLNICSIEIKISANTPSQAIRDLHSFCKEHRILLAIEPDLSTSSWIESLEDTLEILSLLAHSVALKCRGSGPTGISPERLAHVICRIDAEQLPFKVTGGFHHPIVEKTLYGNTMGFLNLTLAVMLRRIHHQLFPEERVASLLINQSPNAFINEDYAQYGEYLLDAPSLLKAKNQLSFTIGSCSLHEPDADLVRLFPIKPSSEI